MVGGLSPVAGLTPLSIPVDLFLPSASAIACTLLWFSAGNCAAPPRKRDLFSLVSSAIASFCVPFVIGLKLIHPGMTLLSAGLAVAAGFDLADGLVPDSIWYAMILGRFLLWAFGLIPLPDIAAVTLAAVFCVSLRLWPAKRYALAGEADLAAWLTLSFSLPLASLLLFAGLSALLTSTAALWQERQVPYLPYCFCSLLPLCYLTQ